MKPSLELKIGQQLTMTPQLQQAIRLLQLSTLDLQQEIQQAIESNPLLEQEEGSPESNASEESNSQEDDAGNETGLTDFSAGEKTEKPSEDAESQEEWSEQIPSDLPVDSGWDDIYQSSSSGQGERSDDDFTSRSSAPDSLQDHLEWQLNLTPMSDTDRLIGIAIIDAINNDGYLTCPLEDILEGMEPALELELDEIEVMLHRIQQFDPVGVACRDLRECLLLQLNSPDYQDEPALPAAQKVADQHLDRLGSRDYTTIMRKAKLKEPELKSAIELIQTLNPKPGSSLETSEAEYVIPDVLVSKKQGEWSVELNPDASPRLRINTGYSSLIRRADSSSDNTYLKNQLQEARWFIKSLQSRSETLLKVATRIVDYQRGFFDYGEEAMKPLVLHDIAESVEMHESTISRVTTQKYMHTPRGIFELKYFFSSHVSTASGGECSSTAIRALIKKLVSQENPRKPLSDNKIATMLAEQGIQVARRTIAKYRESIMIPPSNERKRLV
ncbi:RNA polymerase factor sigma-54 [Kistimonas asteriae]|uniref:RNA polymerase factor sigma-54 n=1 Tax=Kistimonas asteriae TaxID=517724 RepID=UPI001BABCF89|nr:RNA polymerase factor sigma-54 [Kistimonas asteriae]